MFLTFCKCEEVLLPRTYRTSSHQATQASLRTVGIRYLLLKVHFKISDNRLVSTAEDKGDAISLSPANQVLYQI